MNVRNIDAHMKDDQFCFVDPFHVYYTRVRMYVRITETASSSNNLIFQASEI